MKKTKMRFMAWILILAMLGGYGNVSYASEEGNLLTVSGSHLTVEEDVGEESVSDNTTQTEEAQASEKEQEETTVSDNELSAATISANELTTASVFSDNQIASTANYTPYWKGTGNYSNLIVFVDFSDTAHEHPEDAYGGVCYKEGKGVEDTFKYFNGSDIYPRGMRQYLYNISYGQLRVENLFPQYDAAANRITPYRLNNTAAYYAAHEEAMVAAVIEQLNSSGQVQSSMNLDLNGGDNILDNLTIVVPCEEGNRNNLFVGHKANYAGSETVKGKRVSNYNVIHEMGVYFGLNNSGLIIHEFLHTIGYPDLYRRSIVSGAPVGTWDIMSSESYRVQYPLAYLRSAYTGWFKMETVENSGSFSLYAASKATEETKDQQALILKTDYSDTEFFVVEYRKKGAAYTEEYEQILPGSGLIVYRVNTAVEKGNIAGPPDMIYIFRPGDTYDSKEGYEKGGGDYTRAYLSLESGRTGYGSSDLNTTLEGGAITYSDGVNSGIVISNVGSAAGDRITFDITFTERKEGENWVTLAKEDGDTETTNISSWLDSDGTFYHMLTRGTTTTAELYRQEGESFAKIGNAPTGYYHKLVKYKDSLYTAYINASYHPILAKWTGSGWSTLYQSSANVYGNDFDLTADSQGVYMVYTDNSTVYALKTTGSKATVMGSSVGTSNYAAGLSITAENGKVAVLYRHFFQNNQAVIKTYNSADNSWSDVGSQSYQVNGGKIKLNKGKLYLVSHGTNSSTAAYLYTYDLEQPGSAWTQAGAGPFTEASIYISDICFVGNEPYIVYTDGASPYRTAVVYLQNDTWTARGDDVAKVSLSGLGIFSYGDRLYVTYANSVTRKAFVRTNFSAKGDSPQEDENVSTEWSLNYEGMSPDPTEGAEEFGSLDDLYLTLERLSLDEGAKIRVDYKGQNIPEALPGKLLQLCADRNYNLQFSYIVREGDTQYLWSFEGLRRGKAYQDCSLNTQLITSGAELAEEFTEEAYIQLLIPKQLPSCAGIKLTLYGQDIGKVFLEKNTVYQWKLNGSDMSMTGEASVDRQRGEWVSFTLSSDEATGYLLTPQSVYGWQKLSNDSGEGWMYIEHRSTKPVIGWQTIQGRKCYFTEEGFLAEGPVQVGKYFYLFGSYEEGTQGILTGEQEIKGKKYYADRKGILLTGWQKVNGSLCYYHPQTGALQHSEIRSDNWAVVTTDEKETLYFYLIGKKTVAKGLRTIKGTKYYFDNGGVLQIGFYTVGKNTYYGNTSGEPGEGLGVRYTGEREIEGEKYYFASNGSLQTGFRKIGGIWRFFSTADYSPERGKEEELSDCQVEDGKWYWYTIKGERYCIYRNKTVLKGWQTVAGKRYYFNPATYAMERGNERGLLVLGKNTYYLEKGVRQTGWIEGKTYYANSKGVLLTGWQKIEGAWYYFSYETKQQIPGEQIHWENNLVQVTENGRDMFFYLIKGKTLAKGWKTIDGRRYYFDSVSGERKTGLFRVGKTWYYYEENGIAKEGWWENPVNGAKYFFKKGVALTGWRTIDKGRYYFNADGMVQTQLTQVGKYWYFFGTDGKMRTGFIRYCNNTYYFNGNGRMVKGWQRIGGQRYYFGEDGCLQL